MIEQSQAPRRSQLDRRSEAEQRLLHAAAELIAEIGPARVTLANIGERAGYSRGLATHYFGSKGAMMKRLVDEVTAQFRRAIVDDGKPRSAAEDLHSLTGTYFDVIADLQPVNRARLVLWADAVATGSPDIRPAMVAADRDFRAAIVTGIERGIAAGEIDAAVSPEGLATVLIAMLRGVALESLLHDDIDLGACRREVEALLDQRLRHNSTSRTHT